MCLASYREISKVAPFWNIVVVSKTWKGQVELMFYYLSILFCFPLGYGLQTHTSLSVITPSVFSLSPFHLFNFSPSLCLSGCLLLSAPSTDRPIHPPTACAGLALRREGGREDCSGWAFLLFLRWQRHRGAIDSNTRLHSLLMLECVILWRFSQTEMERAESLKCAVHFNL